MDANHDSLSKFNRTKPYNIFYNTTANVSDVNTMQFKDLLCPSLGQIKSSLHINFLVDLLWLFEQYQLAKCETKPMTVLYGYEIDYQEEETIEVLNKIMPNVKYYLIETQDIFGINHSRLSIFEYADGSVRIAILSGNLKELDWNSMNQSIWLSEACPKMPGHLRDTDCSGPTGFKKALVNYLKKYKMSAALTDWINIIRRADFSNIKVVLVSSIPGAHYIKGLGCHVLDMAYYLKKYCTLTDDPNSWALVASVSSLGSYGDNAAAWLTTFFLRSLGRHRESTAETCCEANLYIVYPSIKNVKSMDLALPISQGKKDYQQEWLKKFLHQWKAERSQRTPLMPYAKSYCRISPCHTKLAWFLLTSANLAKSDWGVKWNADVYVRSWELGILFLPKFFNMEFFPIECNDDMVNNSESVLPLIFDIPLISYANDDIAY